jgi:hypothetical protein
MKRGHRLQIKQQPTYMSLNQQQKDFFNITWNAVQEDKQLLSFLDRKAGTGKPLSSTP